jgi:hypothetical protein
MSIRRWSERRPTVARAGRHLRSAGGATAEPASGEAGRPHAGASSRWVCDPPSLRAAAAEQLRSASSGAGRQGTRRRWGREKDADARITGARSRGPAGGCRERRGRPRTAGFPGRLAPRGGRGSAEKRCPAIIRAVEDGMIPRWRELDLGGNVFENFLPCLSLTLSELGTVG